MAKTYTICEYSSFSCNKEVAGYVSLPEKTFKSLERFILENNCIDSSMAELMGISVRKGIGKVITAKNYVGVISMNDGTTIEILPKAGSEEDKEASKKLLIKMLKTLKSAPYKTMQKTNLNVDKLNVFEIFIRMFIDEVYRIVKHGLKYNYETLRDNLNVCKGKLNFSEHIKRNVVHKEKFFVEYDEFNSNRAENRLLKSTLSYLYGKTTSAKNKNDIRTLLNSFADIDKSRNFTEDFAKCVADRNTKDYAVAVKWCEVFLGGKSFTSFSGSDVAFALLFPMETLFESYVASVMQKSPNVKEYSFTVQDKRYSLFDKPEKFGLRPDIVIEGNGSVFVMDTKWKILELAKSNYGISQADMYQMYVYHKKYVAKSVTLIYPKPEEEISEEKLIFRSQEENLVVKVKFVDLYDDSSIHKVLNEIVVSQK